MKTITNAEFIEAVDKALAKRGDNFLYVNPKVPANVPGPFPGCTYGPAFEGAVSCLFGLALTEFLGLTYDRTWECGGLAELVNHLENYDVARFHLSRSVLGAAVDAQSQQDRQETYGFVRTYWERNTASFRNAEGKVTA